MACAKTYERFAACSVANVAGCCGPCARTSEYSKEGGFVNPELGVLAPDAHDGLLGVERFALWHCPYLDVRIMQEVHALVDPRQHTTFSGKYLGCNASAGKPHRVQYLPGLHKVQIRSVPVDDLIVRRREETPGRIHGELLHLREISDLA